MRIEKTGSPSLFILSLLFREWMAVTLDSFIIIQTIHHTAQGFSYYHYFKDLVFFLFFLFIFFFARVARRQSRPIFNNHTQGATGLFHICAQGPTPKTKTHKSFFLLL